MRGIRVAVLDDHPGQDAVLTIDDGGKGVPEGGIGASDGCGILIMERRAKNIGGEISITRRLEGGTRLTCHFRH